MRKQIGVVGVDSGQIIVCDPCYLESDWKKPTKKVLFNKKGEFSYNGCCTATVSKDNGGQLNYKLGHAGAGVAVSSGYGDGTYPVYAEYIDEGYGKRISSITIDFMGTYTQKFAKGELE